MKNIKIGLLCILMLCSTVALSQVKKQVANQSDSEVYYPRTNVIGNMVKVNLDKNTIVLYTPTYIKMRVLSTAIAKIVIANDTENPSIKEYDVSYDNNALDRSPIYNFTWDISNKQKVDSMIRYKLQIKM